MSNVYCIFDLDGTLLDTAPDLVASLNHVRGHEGLEDVDPGEYRQFASHGALGLIKAGLPEGDEALTEARKTRFLQHYECNLYVETQPFSGVTDLLGFLDSRAIPWGIVTNKPEYLTLPILKEAQLAGRAACVICGDTLKYSKPHPAPVQLGCQLLGCSADQTLMVGDDVRDLEAGHSAGTLTAMAAYGYLAPEGPDPNPGPGWIVQRPLDVIEIINQTNSTSI